MIARKFREIAGRAPGDLLHVCRHHRAGSLVEGAVNRLWIIKKKRPATPRRDRHRA